MPSQTMPKRKRRTQRERSAATQEKLLAATIDCIVELGYAGTSTTEVCKRAGMSRGAQVHHYPTKAELVAAAIEYLFEQRHREFRGSLGNDPELDSALAGLWALYSGPTLHAWMELLVASRTDPALSEQLRHVDERFFDQARLTCRWLFGLHDADEATVSALTRMILSVLDGLALNRTLYRDDSQQRAALELFERALVGLQVG